MISGRVEHTASAKEIPINEPTAQNASAAPAPPSAEDSGGEVVPKHSKAFQLWSGVIVLVLISLWMQTTTKEPSYNFLIEGNRDAAGAQVALDGTSVGSLQQSSAGGVDIIGLHVHVPDGHHTVTVSKPGFKTVTQQFDMRGEDYVNVQMEPQQTP